MAYDHMAQYSPLKPGVSDISVAEQRERVRREEAAIQAERQASLSQQSSPLRAPEERIRLWEKLHMLPLPESPHHQLVHVIALQTQLTVGDVQSEQMRRAAL